MMEEMDKEKQRLQEVEENEIDLIELVRRFWEKRKFIVKVTAIFLCLGLLIAIFTPEEYTAQCVVVPQTGESGVSSSLSLQKEMINTEIYFDRWGRKLTLLDYFTNEEYQRTSVLGVVKKYTIGLPWLILSAIRGEGEEETAMTGEDGQIAMLTKDEDDCIKALKERTTLTVNDKDGYVNISATMPEPLAAAALAEIYMNLLQKYVSEFKIEKAKADYNFINQRYLEAREEYSKKQEEYARFRDANRIITTAVAATREEQIKNDYDLAYSLYSELSRQLIQAEIKVKENTPIFTVVEPVIVPRERSKPKRMMTLVAFGFLGGVLSCGAVLAFDFLKKRTEIKYLKNW